MVDKLQGCTAVIVQTGIRVAASGGTAVPPSWRKTLSADPRYSRISEGRLIETDPFRGRCAASISTSSTSSIHDSCRHMGAINTVYHTI